MLRFLIVAGLSIALMPKVDAGWCGGGANCGCGVVVAQHVRRKCIWSTRGRYFLGRGTICTNWPIRRRAATRMLDPSIPAIPTGNTVRAGIPAAFTVPMWDILTQHLLLHSTGLTDGDTGISIDRLASAAGEE